MVSAVILAATIGMSATDSINCSDRAATADPRQPVHIVLQIVAPASAEPGVLRSMGDAAAAIWAPHDVLISPDFTKSRPEDRDGEWITVVFRNQPANRIDGRPARGYPALASLVFTEDGPGDVIYASFETALRMIRDAGIGRGAASVEEAFAATLLGRAIAHELGHFLLKSPRHTRSGLMRASFKALDSTSRDRERYALSPADVRTLANRRSMCGINGIGAFASR